MIPRITYVDEELHNDPFFAIRFHNNTENEGVEYRIETYSSYDALAKIGGYLTVIHFIFYYIVVFLSLPHINITLID